MLVDVMMFDLQDFWFPLKFLAPLFVMVSIIFKVSCMCVSHYTNFTVPMYMMCLFQLFK